MKSVKLFFLFLLFSIQAFGFQIDEATLESANASYNAGDFSAAVDQYEKLIEEGYQTAGIHYNLANAYYRKNNLGSAILHYEKAILLDPKDSDIIYNLNLVRENIPDQFEVIQDFFLTAWYSNLRNQLSPTGWGLIGLILLWGGIAGVILRYRGKSRTLRKKSFILGIVLIVLSTLPFLLGFGLAKKQQNSQRAVIMVSQTDLKNAPDEMSEKILELHEGTSLRILDEIGDWKKIRLSNGEEGWIKTKVLGMI